MGKPNVLAAVWLCLAASPAAAAPGADAPLQAARASVEKARECLGALDAGIKTAASGRAGKCRADFPALEDAVASHRGELVRLSCRGNGELERWWRCRGAARTKNGSNGDYCRWLAGRSKASGADGACLAMGADACRDHPDQAFAGLARLGGLLIEGARGRAAAPCAELFGAASAAGCARLAAGDAAGACSAPGFRLAKSGTESCLASAEVLLGRSSCPESLRSPELRRLCRELALYRRAREAKNASACGTSEDAAVCRALYTGDPKACGPAGDAVAASACSLFVDGLADDEAAAAEEHRRLAAAGMTPAARARCRAPHEEARRRVAEAQASAAALEGPAGDRATAELKSLEQELFAMGRTLDAVRPPRAPAAKR